MAGFIPAIHVFSGSLRKVIKTWMAGTSPAMTSNYGSRFAKSIYFFAGGVAGAVTAGAAGLSSRSTLAVSRSLAT